MKLLFLSLLLVGSFAKAADVNFHITNGTIDKPWNTASDPITAKVGDTIHFYNDDSVVHRLHTDGAPCDHGPDFAPGEMWDCFASIAYSSKTDGPLHDHDYGDDAFVWIEVSE